MAKNSKQSSSSSVLTKCFRFNKPIPKSIHTNNNNNITPITSSVNTCPLSSVIEAIQTIDQLVQRTESDFDCIENTMNIEQIEEMLIKWTHIAHFLIDTYQQIHQKT